MSILPKPEAFAREALIVIGGAMLATLILSMFPRLKSYINSRDCDCDR